MSFKKITYHPVELDRDKCKGCINCMKRCPTEAIRVRDGKAHILYDKCIGCGECVRICTHRAKKAVYDGMERMDAFRYKVALAPPSLYGQFNHLDDIDYVLNGLKTIGFDYVFEVSRAAELCSLVTRKRMQKPHLTPVISSACPAISELIQLRFPTLVPHLLDVLSPVEIAAKIARRKAVKHTGFKEEEIGVFFISPCPAKVYALKKHLTTDRRLIDGVFAVSEVYFKLLAAMKDLTSLQAIKNSGIVGIGWATIGGEAFGTLEERNLSADGIDNCISVLKKLENGELSGIEFVELNACPGGCVGGVLNIENAFVAKAKIKAIRKYLPVMLNRMEDYDYEERFYLWDKVPENLNALRLGSNIDDALELMSQIEEIEKTLPSLDCGACGAPSCRAFAEDVVISGMDIEKCLRRNSS